MVETEWKRQLLNLNKSALIRLKWSKYGANREKKNR